LRDYTGINLKNDPCNDPVLKKGADFPAFITFAKIIIIAAGLVPAGWVGKLKT
jgi:hypothetical protein